MSGRPKLLSIDAFAKTVEDARVKTASGGFITVLCVFVVLYLIRNEYVDYTSIITRPELLVDREINKKLDITIDISFPNIPCDVLMVDILDESGNLKLDILKSDFKKFRLVGDREIPDDSEAVSDKSLEELAKGLKEGETGYCGSCYGALPQDKNEYCCNTCETIRLAYAAKMWAFYDGAKIDQCEKEGYVARVQERVNNKEGCRVKGTTQINRISGNLHFAPGASYTEPGRHVHDLSLYQKYEDKFNFDHTIHHLSFGKNPTTNALVDTQSIHPLDGHKTTLNLKYQLFSYYLKVVATRFEYLNGVKPPLETNQFSAINHDRPLRGGKDVDHSHTLHAQGGIPGVFFHFEISPLKIINKEQYAKTWSGFVLGVISSIAGVLMVGSVLDRSVWAAENAIRGKKNE